jgi:hypothetical protein
LPNFPSSRRTLDATIGGTRERLHDEEVDAAYEIAEAAVFRAREENVAKKEAEMPKSNSASDIEKSWRERKPPMTPFGVPELTSWRPNRQHRLGRLLCRASLWNRWKSSTTTMTNITSRPCATPLISSKGVHRHEQNEFVAEIDRLAAAELSEWPLA